MRVLVLFLAWPQLAAADPKPPKVMCDPDVAVDRVDDVMQCTGDDQRRFAETSLRQADGWRTSSMTFTRDENAHFDARLADGLRRICAGDDKPLRWASLHTKEFGWPLDTCRRNARSIIVFKGSTRFVLDRPRVDEMWQAQRLMHAHDLGRHEVWRKTP
jgi:hypothetical protein